MDYYDEELNYEHKRLSIELNLIKSMLGAMDESDDPAIRKLSKAYRTYMKDSIRAINDKYTDKEEDREFEDVL